MEKNFTAAPILICVAATALNLLGMFVTRTLELPLYFDTVGTIFIAMMSGYVPGIVVGFVTHFLASFADEAEMYYCSVSIFVAIYTTFLARRNFFRNFFKALLTIPALALVATILSEFIGKFLFCTGVVEALSEIQMHFATIFLQEIFDKGLSVMAAFALIKIFPTQIKNIFRGLGQRQAPLTAEMKSAVYQRKCPASSLRFKALLILSLSSLFIAASIASISYRIFEQAAIAAQMKIGEGLATIAANEIDTAKDFETLEKNLLNIKAANPDVKSLRIEKFSEAGKSIEPIISDDGNDRRLTICKPVYDAAGNIKHCVEIELSLEMIDDYGRTFTAKVLALFSGCFVFVFVIGLRFVENNIVLPVNTMEYCAKNFAYDSDKVCENNLERLRRLEIHTGDEIENLYHALLKTTQDVMYYLENFRRAQRQVAEMDELAHKDSLTGIKNKAAYDEETARLDEKISKGEAEFFIAMVDVNFLKRVNDTYGHERGNEYLINACRLICSVFGEEHVYRIGGDEFVVVIEGEKVSLCKYFIKQFAVEMERKSSNQSLEAWEKISAAIGTATYQKGEDKFADEVFRRADKKMYANKLAMKAARTD